MLLVYITDLNHQSRSCGTVLLYFIFSVRRGGWGEGLCEVSFHHLTSQEFLQKRFVFNNKKPNEGDQGRDEKTLLFSEIYHI
jgi:hypothetical protein